MTLCGIVPALVVSYTTGPTVLFMHLHLPHYARYSREILQRYVRSLSPSARLHLTTMGFLTRPRYGSAAVEDVRAARSRLGIANYDVPARAAGKRAPLSVHGNNRKVKEGWVWAAIQEKLVKTTGKKP